MIFAFTLNTKSTSQLTPSSFHARRLRFDKLINMSIVKCSWQQQTSFHIHNSCGGTNWLRLVYGSFRYYFLVSARILQTKSITISLPHVTLMWKHHSRIYRLLHILEFIFGFKTYTPYQFCGLFNVRIRQSKANLIDALRKILLAEARKNFSG